MSTDGNDVADTLEGVCENVEKLRSRESAYFVTTNERGLCLNGPVTLGGVKIGVADTSADKLDETFTRSELRSLLDGEVVVDLELGTSGLDDSGLLDSGDRHFNQEEFCCERRELFCELV